MAFVGSAFIQVIANTSQFDSGVERAIKRLEDRYGDAGRNIGVLFGKKVTASFKDLDREAVRVYQGFNQLIERSYYVQGALAAFVPVISAVVSGLAALVAQIGAATPSLIVLPSIFSAAAQAMATLKLAFSGIGKAMQQMGRGAGDTSQKLKNLNDAAKNAEDALTRATWRHKDAQDALNKSYAIAAERIEQLNFDAEDAALAQKRAAIALEEARESLKRVQDLPPNSKARREAELAFQEADLNYRRAVDRNEDLQKEQNETTANGTKSFEQQVKDSDEVVDAARNLLDATMALTKARRDDKDAAEKLKKAQQGIFDGVGGTDAIGKLTEAQKKFADFLNGLKPQVAELKAAAGENLFGPLTTAIQNLVDNFKEPLIKMLQDTGGALGDVAVQISKVVTEKDNLKNFEIVTQQNVETIRDMGTVFGNLYDSMLTLLAAASPLVDKFTNWLTVITEGWKNTLEAKNKTGELTDMFNYAGEVAANLGDIIGNLIGAFMNIGRAAAGRGSGGEMIVTSIEEWSQRFEDFTAKLLANGELEEFFRKVSDVFLKVLGYIKDIGKAFLKSGGADETGKSVDAMGGAVDNLIGAFEKIVASGPAFADFLVKFTGFIKAASESESIKMFFTVLSQALSILNAILSNDAVASIFKVLAAYHAMRLGVTRIGKVVGGTAKYLRGDFLSMADTVGKAGKKIKAGANFTKWAVQNRSFLRQYFAQWAKGTKVWAYASKVQGKLTGSTKALGSGMKALGTGTKNAGNSLVKFSGSTAGKFKTAMTNIGSAIKNSTVYTKLASAATKVWAGVQAAFNAVMAANPIVLIAIAIAALIAILVAAYFRFKWFRDFVDSVWDVIAAGLTFLWENVLSPVFSAMGSVFAAVWGGIQIYFSTVWGLIQTAISFAWDNIIQPVFRAFGTVFEAIWGGIQIYFSTVWGLIQTAVTFAWNNVIRPVFEAIGRVFGNIWTGIRNAFTDAWNFITGVISGAQRVFGRIGDAIVGAFRSAINFIIRAWNGIEFTVPSVKVAGRTLIPGFTLGLPDIPELAQGGVVRPSLGGTLARIGEGGRPERIEPLDPNGLSKRDKALIAELSGGVGATINVYPSPGMDEVELANVVSRQLAFHMRRGVL